MTPTGTLRDLHEPSASSSRVASRREKSSAFYAEDAQPTSRASRWATTQRSGVRAPERERRTSRPQRTGSPVRTTPRRNSRVGSKQQISVR